MSNEPSQEYLDWIEQLKKKMEKIGPVFFPLGHGSSHSRMMLEYHRALMSDDKIIHLSLEQPNLINDSFKRMGAVIDARNEAALIAGTLPKEEEELIRESLYPHQTEAYKNMVSPNLEGGIKNGDLYFLKGKNTGKSISLDDRFYMRPMCGLGFMVDDPLEDHVPEPAQTQGPEDKHTWKNDKSWMEYDPKPTPSDLILGMIKRVAPVKK